MTANDAEIRRELQPTIVQTFYDMLTKEYEEQSDGKVKVNFTLEQASLILFFNKELKAEELFDLAVVDQTNIVLIFLPFTKKDRAGRNESPGVLEAVLQKLELRMKLGLNDALEIIVRRGWDGFAERI